GGAARRADDRRQKVGQRHPRLLADVGARDQAGGDARARRTDARGRDAQPPLPGVCGDDPERGHGRGPTRLRREAQAELEGPLASPRESTRMWTGWMPMALGFRARSPRIQPPAPPEKTPSWDSATGVARSDEHHHAHDTARSRAEHLLGAMAARKTRCLRASNRRPLPVMSALR